jgi:hypothetical protein
VECGLEACIAKLMKSEEFPDKSFAEKCWTHDLERLLILAGLKDERDANSAADAAFSDNGGTVKDWNESSRYERTAKARCLALYKAFPESKHGVFRWIKFHW